jgi:hypothetical protein
MRKRGWFAVVAGALVLSSAQGQAPDTETAADMRCVIVGMRLAGMTDPTARSSGMMGALYYLGRVEGRTPKLDVETLMIEQISKMTSSDYSSETQRCGNGLTAKGKQISQIGKDMIERGQKMLDKGKSPTG